MFLKGAVFFLLLLVPALACAEPAPALFRVAQVLSGKSFVTTAGDTVRLASIEAPNVQEADTPARRGRPGEPLGDEAKAALERLIAGRDVRIDYNPGQRDRHNRLLGQVTRDDGLWVQGEMLREGYAMVYSFSDDEHDVIVKMLAAEHEARAKNLGIWVHPYFRVITPEEAAQFINRFKIVEGTVVSVNDYHGHTYLNFSEHWKGHFAVFVSRKFAKAFAGTDLHALAGRKVSVRGWINDHHAPMIDITRPEQLEVE